MPVRQRASVSIETSHEDPSTPDFNPDEVTSLLGIEPSRVIRRGTSRRPGGPLARVSSWILEDEEVETYDTNGVVLKVLGHVTQQRDVLVSFVRERGLVAGVNVTIYMEAEKTFATIAHHEVVWGVPTPASYLEADTVGLLASLGMSVGFDQYVDMPDFVDYPAT